jgi:hypothetical protein
MLSSEAALMFLSEVAIRQRCRQVIILIEEIVSSSCDFAGSLRFQWLLTPTALSEIE